MLHYGTKVSPDYTVDIISIRIDVISKVINVRFKAINNWDKTSCVMKIVRNVDLNKPIHIDAIEAMALEILTEP